MGDLSNYLNSIKGKRIAVIGSGISNTPLIELLLKNGIDTTVCDKRSSIELSEAATRYEKLGAKLRLGEDYLDNLNEDIIFRTPGLMPTNPALKKAVARGATLTSEMEVFFDLCKSITIGVTGSDGKTTTTSIIAELLRNNGLTVHIGGNIGTPLLCKVDDMKPGDVAVIELSSFQLITMKKSPNIAVVTNLSPNHLDVHTDMDEYVEAKKNIFMHQTYDDRVVFNLDNEITRDYAKNAPAEEVFFFSRQSTVENGMFLHNGTIYEAFESSEMAVMQADDIALPGVHNVENYLAAFTAVMGFVCHGIMRETARSFRGVEHRIEPVRELNGVKYYNDSIASSPSRAIAGLRALTPQIDDAHGNEPGRVILIAGGKDKGIPFDELGEEIVKRVKTLVLTGAAADQIHEAVLKTPGFSKSDSPNTLEIHQCDDFEDAVLTASKLASDGDIVVLSPACTSFDKFSNFEERGNKFKDIVNRLV